MLLNAYLAFHVMIIAHTVENSNTFRKKSFIIFALFFEIIIKKIRRMPIAYGGSLYLFTLCVNRIQTFYEVQRLSSRAVHALTCR